MSTAFDYTPTEELLYWEYIGVDQFGTAEYKTPVRVEGWYSDRQEKFITSDNQETLSKGILYIDIHLKNHSWISKVVPVTTATDPMTLESARMIKQINSYNDHYDYEDKLYKVFLQ